MASPMPEEVTISVEEYSNLLMARDAADCVYGIIYHIAHDPECDPIGREFALGLLDEWTK